MSTQIQPTHPGSPNLTNTKARWDATHPSRGLRFGRILKSLTIVGLAFLLLLVLRRFVLSRLGNEAFATGYTLLAICLTLCLLGVRKRLPASRLGPVAIWQTTHHFLGVFCLLAYCVHAGVMTTGWLESCLAILFWFILLTGFASWYVNRSAPKLLRAAGTAILRSDIPEAKLSIARDAYAIAIEAAGNADSCTIADFYRSRLEPFFSSNRSFFYRISPSGKLRRTLQAELDVLTRYLDDKGLQLQKALAHLIKERDDLDFQSAIQVRIRFVAAVHTCLLGAFLVMTGTHVTLAFLYSSHW
jgi:hypothetical protein